MIERTVTDEIPKRKNYFTTHQAVNPTWKNKTKLLSEKIMTEEKLN
jgi:hypothetical protein